MLAPKLLKNPTTCWFEPYVLSKAATFQTSLSKDDKTFPSFVESSTESSSVMISEIRLIEFAETVGFFDFTLID